MDINITMSALSNHFGSDNHPRMRRLIGKLARYEYGPAEERSEAFEDWARSAALLMECYGIDTAGAEDRLADLRALYA